jgi:superoxide reductase
MTTLSEQFQGADWKTEKHVPVIECPDSVSAGQIFEVKLTIGKEVPHPNTTDHHIRWIALYFKADGDKFTYEIGHYSFDAHGESAAGPDKGPAYTDHSVTARLSVNKPGVLFASALCNIHGLWQNSKKIAVG